MNRVLGVQITAYILGFILMIAMFFIDYKRFERFEKIIYAVSLLLLISVYTPLGVEHYSSRAWLNLGVTEIQPSEIVKISFIILFACYLKRNRDNLFSLKGVLFAVLYAAPFLVLIVKEDLGSGIVMTFIWVGMIFYAGIDRKLFLKLTAMVVVAMPVAYFFMAPHQKQRIDAFLNPDDTSIEAVYQVWQSKIAIGSGGWFGKGLFQGTQKSLNFLPVQESDFIFAVIVEELGFVGGVVIILLFMFMFFRIGRIANKAKDFFGSLIVIGFLSMFAFQMFENIAMTMGLMPVTGVTLPFISAGGTAIAANLLSLGIILNVGMRSKTINF